MIDKFVYFLFVVTNIMLCVLVTVDMYQGKKALDQINVEFKAVHDMAAELNNDLDKMNQEAKQVQKLYRTFDDYIIKNN